MKDERGVRARTEVVRRRERGRVMEDRGERERERVEGRGERKREREKERGRERDRERERERERDRDESREGDVVCLPSRCVLSRRIVNLPQPKGSG